MVLQSENMLTMVLDDTQHAWRTNEEVNRRLLTLRQEMQEKAIPGADAYSLQ